MFRALSCASKRTRGRYVSAIPRIVEMMSQTGRRTAISRTFS